MEDYYEDFLRAYLWDLYRSEAKIETLIKKAIKEEYPIYHFKRVRIVPRIAKILGMLKGMLPKEGTLLDVGIGKGRTTWPILETFTNNRILSIDKDENSFFMASHVKMGGINNFYPMLGDIAEFKLDLKIDILSALEVLEHIPNYKKAIKNMCSLSDKIIISVPSEPDDNPDHVNLFTEEKLVALFGINKMELKFDNVPGHLIAIASKKSEEISEEK